jgi:endonuclease G
MLSHFVRIAVDAVEKAAGLSLFDSVTKATSKELCKTVKCDVIVRRFDDAAKKGGRRDVAGARV